MKALLMSDVEAWFENAQAGDRMVYHQGCLAIDRAHDTDKAHTLARVAARFLTWSTWTKRGVHLVQQRYSAHKYDYLAIKR